MFFCCWAGPVLCQWKIHPVSDEFKHLTFAIFAFLFLVTKNHTKKQQKKVQKVKVICLQMERENASTEEAEPQRAKDVNTGLLKQRRQRWQRWQRWQGITD